MRLRASKSRLQALPVVPSQVAPDHRLAGDGQGIDHEGEERPHLESNLMGGDGERADGKVRAAKAEDTRAEQHRQNHCANSSRDMPEKQAGVILGVGELDLIGAE